jgi:hypothetical protein
MPVTGQLKQESRDRAVGTGKPREVRYRTAGIRQDWQNMTARREQENLVKIAGTEQLRKDNRDRTTETRQPEACGLEWTARTGHQRQKS